MRRDDRGPQLTTVMIGPLLAVLAAAAALLPILSGPLPP